MKPSVSALGLSQAEKLKLLIKAGPSSGEMVPYAPRSPEKNQVSVAEWCLLAWGLRSTSFGKDASRSRSSMRGRPCGKSWETISQDTLTSPKVPCCRRMVKEITSAISSLESTSSATSWSRLLLSMAKTPNGSSLKGMRTEAFREVSASRPPSPG